MTRNVGTPEGHALGLELARLVDEAEPCAATVGRVLPPEPPPVSMAEKDALWESICDSARGA